LSLIYLVYRGGFNRRPLVQWLTRPLEVWALQASGPRGLQKTKFVVISNHM